MQIIEKGQRYEAMDGVLRPRYVIARLQDGRTVLAGDPGGDAPIGIYEVSRCPVTGHWWDLEFVLEPGDIEPGELEELADTLGREPEELAEMARRAVEEAA